MPAPNEMLPPEVLDAVRRGQTIEAIKLLRETTGLGLKEAKDLVDAVRSGALDEASVAERVDAARQRGDVSGALGEAGTLQAAVDAALQRGDMVEAIRLVREQTGLGLKEAKDRVEAQRTPRSGADFGARDSVSSGKLMMWLVAAALIAAGAYYAIMHGTP